jgi:hypothetical protein
MLGDLIQHIPQTQKFDFGLLEEAMWLPCAGAACGRFSEGSLRLPFSDCYFEHRWHEPDGTEVVSAYLASDGIAGVETGDDHDFDFVVTEFREYPPSFFPTLNRGVSSERIWIWSGLVVTVKATSADQVGIKPLVDFNNYQHHGKDELLNQALNAASPVMVMCWLLGHRETTARDIAAPRHVNRIRERKRKAPLFAHRVITIGPNATIDAQAAAPKTLRQSPRAHLRRGHSRTLPSGRSVWVRACAVGDERRGVVTHDYRFSQVAASASPAMGAMQ